MAPISGAPRTHMSRIATAAAGPVGFVVLVRPDGSVQRVADGLEFPNGMAVTADGSVQLQHPNQR